MNAASTSVHDQNPSRLATSAIDGSTRLVNLLDWGEVVNFGQERSESFYHAESVSGITRLRF